MATRKWIGSLVPLGLVVGLLTSFPIRTAQGAFCAASYVNATTSVVEGGTISGILRRQVIVSATDCSPGSGVSCANNYTYRLMFYPTGGFQTDELSGWTWHNDHWHKDLTTNGGDNPFSISLVQNTTAQTDRSGLLVIRFQDESTGFGNHVSGVTCLTQEVWVTVMDDDRPIAVVPLGNGILEGTSGPMFRIYKSGTFYESDLPRTINFTLSGTAQSGTDFTSIGSSTVIPSGANGYVDIQVSALADTALEGTESIVLTLASGQGYTLDSPASATNYLHDDYATVTVKATDGYASEIGGDTGTFTIYRKGNLTRAITVNYAVTGTAVAGGDYTALLGSVTLPAGVLETNLTVAPIADGVIEPARTVVLTLQSHSSYALGLETGAVVTIAGEGAHPRDELPAGERYVRGGGTNSSLYSMVIPLDGLRGTQRANIDANGYSPGRHHYDGGSSGDQAYATNRIEYNTPIASFGSGWGTPLYLGQSCSMGLYHGEPTGDPLLIVVFERSDGSYVDQLELPVPNLNNAADWAGFSTNAFARTVEGYGLKTVLRDAPGLSWGQPHGGYVLTHTATDTATNYFYLVLAAGLMNGSYASLFADNNPAYGFMYELTFEPRPGWRPLFLDQPHFAGEPLPPHLHNKTPEELLSYGAPVTNAVSLSPSACTNLDASPELRRHPMLDQFVADLNNDPLALANYVFNEIDLIDAIAYRDDGQVEDESVNTGGLNRGALGVYLEGQGSPVEQCALLIYFLRQAGYPATYVFPPDGGLKMLDTRLGNMLRMRLNDGQDEQGRLYTTNELITVNYPWVAVYIDNQWVHLYPWLKDSQIIEGLDLADYLPDPYKDEQLWVRDYILGKTNIMAFATLDDDTPGTIFPRWLDSVLKQNAPCISLDDIGMSYVNRRHLCATWEDFPRPTWVANTSTAVESLASPGITNVSPTLTNIFDTITVEVFSVANPQKKIETAEMRMADLHNRKFFVTHTNLTGGQHRLLLHLAPYRPDATGTGSFAASDTNLLNQQVATLTLDGTDDHLRIRLRHRRQRALTWKTALDPDRGFLDLSAAREVLQGRALRKGDVAAINLNTGRITPAMLRVHAEDLWNMERLLSTNEAAASSVPIETYQGSLVYLVGMSYYERTARFDRLNRRLHKVQNLSNYAMGLAKISPRRDEFGQIYQSSVDPVWPNVDMFFREVVTVGNGTTRLDSGWDNVAATRNYYNLSIADLSAQEHAVLNIFFGQSNAVSTVKVLQLAQAKVPSGAPPVVELHYHNYQSAGNTVYNGKALKDHDPGMWSQLVEMFQRPDSEGYVVAWMPPGALTTPSGSFSGMALLALGVDRQAALIGNNQYGAYGERFTYDTVSPAQLPE